LHELIHGLRYLAGVNQIGNVPEEEQLGVVLANIYIAEKGGRALA
jgi:hypothetical protein